MKKSTKDKQSGSNLLNRLNSIDIKTYHIISIIIINFIISLYFLNKSELVTFDGTFYIRYYNGNYPWIGPFSFGYPLLISLFKSFISNEVIAARLVSAILGSALLYPLFHILKNLFSKKIGIILLCFAAFNPIIIRYSTLTYSDIPYLFFILFSLWMYLEKRILFAVGFASVSYLIRPEGLIFAVLYTIIFFFKERKLKDTLLACSIIATIILIFMFENYSRKDEWTITSKTSNIKLYDIDDWRQNEEWKYSESQPSKAELVQNLIDQYPKRLFTLLNHIKTNSTWPIAVLGMIGLFKRTNIFWIFLIQLLLTPFSGANMSLRYGLPYFYPLLVGNGYLINAFKNRMNSKTITVYSIIVVTFLLFNLKYLTQQTLTEPDNIYIGQKWAGQFSKGKIPKHAIVMDRKPYLTFYAGAAKYVETPLAPLEEVIKICLDRNIDYLILNEQVVNMYRPDLRPIMYHKEVNVGSNLITMFNNVNTVSDGQGVRIFLVVESNEAN